MTHHSHHHPKGLQRLLNDMDNPFEGDRDSLRNDLAEDVNDQFQKDADDGLSTLSSEELDFDMYDLRQRLRGRKHTRWMPLVLKAASVLLLLGIPSVLFWMMLNVTHQPEIAQNKSVTVTKDSVEMPAKETPAVPADAQPLKEESKAKAEKTVSMRHVSQTFSGNESVDYDMAEEEEMDVELQRLTEQERVQQHENFRNMNASSAPMKPVADHSAVVHEVRPITGQVFDEMGMPIPGVVVLIKGSSVGTITDMDGQFELPPSPISDTANVVLSFIGYETQEIPLAEQAVNTIQMQPSMLALDEVVVVGYGVQKKSMITGAMSSVEEEKSDMPAYQAATPSVPMAKYLKDIEAQLVYPESGNGSKAAISVRITIAASGSITKVEIIKSPGDDFSREAERVLRLSPVWNPARRDGMAVEETQRLKLTFYPAE